MKLGIILDGEEKERDNSPYLFNILLFYTV